MESQNITMQVVAEIVPKTTPQSVINLPDALEKTIQTFLSNFMSHRTQEAYLTDWREFFVFLEGRGEKVSHPNDVSENHVINYRDFLREKFSPTTINRKLSALSSLYSRLKEVQLVKTNPVNGLRRPKAIVKRRRTGFLDSEVNQILESLDTTTLKGLNDKALLSFLFFTGSRVSEALSVKVKDLEIQEGMWVVHLKGKGEKIRTLPIVKAWGLVDALIKLRAKGPEDYLFTPVRTLENVRMTRIGVHKLIKYHLKRLGIDSSRSAHSVRRTVISNLLESGERLELVQKVAGHASPNVTLRCYNVREEPLSKNPLLNLRYKE